MKANWLIVIAVLALAAAAAGQDTTAPATSQPTVVVEPAQVISTHPPDGGVGIYTVGGASATPIRVLQVKSDLSEDLLCANARVAQDLLGQLAPADMYLFLDGSATTAETAFCFRGGLNIQELLKLTDQYLPPDMKSASNGRYDSGQTARDTRIIIGSEAGDLADNLIVLGERSRLTDAVVAKLGSGDKVGLAEALGETSGADPTAWGGVSLELLKAQMSASGAGSIIDPAGAPVDRLAATFRSEKIARDVQASFANANGPFAGLFHVTRKGATVTFTPRKKGQDVLGTVIAALHRASLLVKRTDSMANLRKIAMAAASYEARTGKAAPSLAALVATKLLGAAATVRPGRSVKAGKVGDDYVYLPVSTQQALASGGASGRLLLAYERPANYKNQGTAVAYADGQVEWVTMARFGQALKTTRASLAK